MREREAGRKSRRKGGRTLDCIPEYFGIFQNLFGALLDDFEFVVTGERGVTLGVLQNAGTEGKEAKHTSRRTRDRSSLRVMAILSATFHKGLGIRLLFAIPIRDVN